VKLLYWVSNVISNVVLTSEVMCVHRFRLTTKTNRFFVKFGTGKPITNGQKEMDCMQRDFGLPSMCSGNARHVVETLKGNANLDASASAGTV